MKMGGSARTTLLLSKIVPAYAGPPERYFRSKRTLRWFWSGPVFRDEHALRYPTRNRLLHLAKEVSVTCGRNFGDEKWPVESQREETKKRENAAPAVCLGRA